VEIPESLREQIGYAVASLVARQPGGGEVAATGVFFRFSMGAKGGVTALLAPRQVLESAAAATLSFEDGVERSGALEPVGQRFTLEVPDPGRFLLPHPEPGVDLVALPMRSLLGAARRAGRRVFHIPLEEAFLGVGPVVQGLHKHERVVTVGFPTGQWEEGGGAVLRAGATGAHPAEDFAGSAQGLVDTPLLPGTAGSPVVIVDEDGYRQGTKDVEGERLVLLGLLTAQASETSGEGGGPARYLKASRIAELGVALRGRLGG